MIELADNAELALDSIKEFLSSPDASEKIGMVLDALGTSAPPDGTSQRDDSGGAFGDISPETIMKIVSAYKSISHDEDRRITLLRAIKPYMRKGRSESVDTAIKLLSLARLAPLLGELKEVL